MSRAAAVACEGWQAAARELLGRRLRFGTLYALTEGRVRSVFVAPDGGIEVLSTRTRAPVPSLVDLVPAAVWSEREAHDLYGLEFAGHQPLRPLVAHVDDGRRWRVPVRGEGVHDVAVGPIHAGVIESGHFRFHVVGERILLLDLRLFYKHRGLEQAAVGSTVEDGIAYAQRACAACAVANSVAYAQAAEQLLGLRASPEMERARTVLVELERLYNHLNDLAAICAGVGFAPGSMAFASLKERAHRLNQRLFAHRFLFRTVEVGASVRSVAGEEAAWASAEVRDLGVRAAAVWRELLFNGSVQDRFSGVGVLSQDNAVRLGAVGPPARASGVATDARQCLPGLVYPGFTPAMPTSPAGDVAARAEMRHLELQATCGMLVELLDDGVEPAEASAGGGPVQVGVGRVESPRGETMCCLESEDGRVARLHLRTASYCNWPALVEAVAGNLLPDFPLINKSFELCYACVDR